MIGWLEDNLVGKVLASLCAGLLAVTLGLGVAWTLPPSASGPSGEADDVEPSLDVPQLRAGEPIEKFAVITERPVFNQGRLPEIITGVDDELEDEEEPEVEAPDVQLAGVVITPSLRMVTLRQSDSEQSLVAFEGKPLEGDFGSWQVSRIEPREVTLVSGSGEEVRLELQVHDAVIEEPPQPVQPKAAETAQADSDEQEAGEDQPLSRAEEIRQRIAERREELRRAAEEGGDPEARSADYRSAIQSMMARKNNQANEEDDQ